MSPGFSAAPRGDVQLSELSLHGAMFPPQASLALLSSRGSQENVSTSFYVSYKNIKYKRGCSESRLMEIDLIIYICMFCLKTLLSVDFMVYFC
jgi:hypothetical protein